ncbi:MAG: RNA 2',3'-cyclic phosphodiesterase [Henriciella sp.]|nr:RNA 2',3'-cyclic phosphodiesterase [Henriciella sp.]
MHRLFAALPISDDLAERLVPLRTDLPGTRWRWREHFHITLHFYGRVDRDTAEEIANALERISAPALELQIAGVGWFGRREPRALYARVAASDTLSELARACRRIARELNLKLSADPFVPHITLAYCNQTPLEAVRSWSETFQTLQSEPILFDRFHLYESFTSANKPSRYVAQADYPLTG